MYLAVNTSQSVTIIIVVISVVHVSLVLRSIVNLIDKISTVEPRLSGAINYPEPLLDVFLLQQGLIVKKQACPLSFHVQIKVPRF